jgi:hypothetical protein
MSDQLTPPGIQPFPAAGSQPGTPAPPPPNYGQPTAAAYGGPSTAPPQGQYWAPTPPPQGYAAPAKRGNGLAITAVVLSALALLVAIGVAIMMVGSSAGGPTGALSGQVTPVDKAVASNDLQAELTKIITDDGGSVDTITCPARSQIGQGLVTVCKGSVDGYDWTGIVVFEDAEGTFVLNEL